MPVEMFADGVEPKDLNAVIWRFLEPWKFEDLIRSSELYFCRADLLDDPDEGIAPEEYRQILGLNPFDLRDIQELNHNLGCLAQFRESFFLNCWYMFSEETLRMWREYGKGPDGVAICSRYSLLKAALEYCDGRPHLGLVRYGSGHLTGWNIQRFITTKKGKYSHEREVRAALWILDELAGGNRHIDENGRVHALPLTPPPERVPKGQRRAVDLHALLTEVVLSPWAADNALFKVEKMIRDAGYSIPVRASSLARYKSLLPEP